MLNRIAEHEGRKRELPIAFFYYYEIAYFFYLFFLIYFYLTI